MYIARIPTFTSKKKLSHTAILLRESYRENGKVKTKTIANITHCSEKEIFAIECALKHKDKLPEIINSSIKRKISKSFGSAYLLLEIAKFLSIDKALGKTLDGKLALMQVITRATNQGSCLSRIRMASEQQAVCEILDIEEHICEDDFYQNLHWLAGNQKGIELELYKNRYLDKAPEIFLYDVTSSYFEGTQNALSDWGYNRDKKKGKKQVVAGLLCDETGYPVSVKLFRGNTLDFNTVHDQIKKVAEDFGCTRVTFVGDRGMLKSKQIDELINENYFFITAITKPQTVKMLNDKIISMSLFDSDIKEVEHEGIRYILRRNPVRAEEIGRNRLQKKEKIEKLCKKKNEYLKEHKRAKVETGLKELSSAIKKAKIDGWLIVEQSTENEREIKLIIDEEALSEISALDGCYVIKSNLPDEVTKECIHERYKDLKYVESGFRNIKTDWLEVRPWHVRTEGSTRGHAFVVMLSYMLIKYLQDAWKELDITVEEGLKILDGLCLLEVKVNDDVKYFEVPEPSDMMQKLLRIC